MRRESLAQAIWLIAAAVNFGLLLFLVKGLKAEGFFSRPKLMSPQNDPKIGSEILNPLRPFLNAKKPLLVIAFGKCSECTLRNLSGWVLMLDRWADEVSGVVVAEEREEVLKGYARQFGWKVPVVADEKGEILRQLNAYFLPRAYGFSCDGKLIWVQESPAMNELEVIRSVVEAEKGKEYAQKVFDRKPRWAEALEKARKVQGR